MKISTDYKTDNYNIYVEDNALNKYLTEYTARYSSVFYLVDSHVYQLHQDILLSWIDAPILLSPGESCKTVESYARTIEELIERGIKRNSLIVAIGGGATGDLAGFIAATILRGVDYIHVPTTVLAHDSAVGGKTAINVPSGKNLIGSFYRPQCVIMDTLFFNTLPDDELLSGYAEVFKHAMLNSEEEADRLMTLHNKAIDIDRLSESIEMGIKTKLRFVNKDEHESNERRYLNLGHTLGHALELNNKLFHGHAVMFGMLYALYVSNQLNQKDIFDVSRYATYFQSIGLDFSKIEDTAFEDLLKYLLKDKKNTTENLISFVLLSNYGECYVKDLSIEEVKKYYTTFNEMLIKDV